MLEKPDTYKIIEDLKNRIAALEKKFPATDESNMEKKLFDFRYELDFKKNNNFVGRNWNDFESDGCWAGPGKVSSIIINSLVPGKYIIKAYLVGEVQKGNIKNMEIKINNEKIKVEVNENLGFWNVEGDFEIEPDYKLPFWNIDFCFECSAKASPVDNRIVSAKFSSLKIEKSIEG